MSQTSPTTTLTNASASGVEKPQQSVSDTPHHSQPSDQGPDNIHAPLAPPKSSSPASKGISARQLSPSELYAKLNPRLHAVDEMEKRLNSAMLELKLKDAQLTLRDHQDVLLRETLLRLIEALGQRATKNTSKIEYEHKLTSTLSDAKQARQVLKSLKAILPFQNQIVEGSDLYLRCMWHDFKSWIQPRPSKHEATTLLAESPLCSELDLSFLQGIIRMSPKRMSTGSDPVVLFGDTPDMRTIELNKNLKDLEEKMQRLPG